MGEVVLSTAGFRISEIKMEILISKNAWEFSQCLGQKETFKTAYIDPFLVC